MSRGIRYSQIQVASEGWTLLANSCEKHAHTSSSGTAVFPYNAYQISCQVSSTTAAAAAAAENSNTVGTGWVRELVQKQNRGAKGLERVKSEGAVRRDHTCRGAPTGTHLSRTPWRWPGSGLPRQRWGTHARLASCCRQRRRWRQTQNRTYEPAEARTSADPRMRTYQGGSRFINSSGKNHRGARKVLDLAPSPKHDLLKAALHLRERGRGHPEAVGGGAAARG